LKDLADDWAQIICRLKQTNPENFWLKEHMAVEVINRWAHSLPNRENGFFLFNREMERATAKS